MLRGGESMDPVIDVIALQTLHKHPDKILVHRETSEVLLGVVPWPKHAFAIHGLPRAGGSNKLGNALEFFERRLPLVPQYRNYDAFAHGAWNVALQEQQHSTIEVETFAHELL